MRKAIKTFNEIWEKAEQFNKSTRTHRFSKIFEQRQRFATVGIYDTVSKKYALFDTINLTGNHRYASSDIPDEIYDMEKIVDSAPRPTRSR